MTHEHSSSKHGVYAVEVSGISKTTTRRVDSRELISRDGSGRPKSMPSPRKRQKMSELVLELPDFENASCKGVGHKAFYDDGLEVEAAIDQDDTIWWSSRPVQHAYLRRMCLSCPIVQECREWGITREKYGFWGGMTATERASERIMRGITVNEIDYQVHIGRIEQREIGDGIYESR
jgi:hypothetical protein